jgi:CxxC motif-containing protein (DUF1111 family)
LTENGPVRQVRFKRAQDSSPDGRVHPLFTIAGRVDAPGCDVRQEDFASGQNRGNLSFRIPTPLFGDGLIEAIPDSAIIANQEAYSEQKQQLGIHGHPNRIASDGSIGKFGWKAEIASLQVFTAEAYAVEQGVTNELFSQERPAPADCYYNSLPEDRFSPFTPRSIQAQSNVALVSAYLRFLAPPPPLDATTPSVKEGQAIFITVGCGQCHTPSLKTGRSSHPALSEQTVDLYSDLLLHHIGKTLADGIRQGSAESDEFRTAPLWGIRLHLFYLHDGRTRNLEDAILAHADKESHMRPNLSKSHSSASAKGTRVLGHMRWPIFRATIRPRARESPGHGLKSITVQGTWRSRRSAQKKGSHMCWKSSAPNRSMPL